MSEVPVEKLIDGRTYRIESRDGMHRPFIGRLRLGSEPFGFPPEFYRSFDKVILDPYEPRSLYGWGPQPTDLEYAEITRSRFFNSPKSLRYNQAYRSVGELPFHYSYYKVHPNNRHTINKDKLSKPLSENTLGIIKGFVEGSKGPYKIKERPHTGLVDPYPPSTTNNKNAEKAKKPRTRKNKRKSRKTNKSKKSKKSRKS